MHSSFSRTTATAIFFAAVVCIASFAISADAFLSTPSLARPSRRRTFEARSTSSDETSVKFASTVTGEELELLLQDMELPLVIDAYATWCGPCLLMAPEFEEAAKELDGKARFVKLDTDQEEAMAGRLNIMGLPTMLFLDNFESEDGSGPSAVLKNRIEGALRKDDIVALAKFSFFDGEKPDFIQQ